MKQFVPQTGGHHVHLDDFMLMQTAYSEAINGVITALEPSGTCILSGFNMTTNPLTGYSFSAGWCALFGEVFKYAGGSLNFVAIPPGGTTPRLFIRIVESVIAPPSPIAYEDTLNKNVHFERVVIIKYFNAGQGDVDGVNGVYYDVIKWAATNQLGFVHEWVPMFSGEENIVFDQTGLGRYRMRGYAICNGLNNTPDLRGQFTYMPSVGVRNSGGLPGGVMTGVSAGQRIGNPTASILQANLPLYNLSITQTPHTHGATQQAHGHQISPMQASFDAAGTPTIRPWKTYVNDGGTTITSQAQPAVYIENATIGITVSSNGGNQPLAIVPPGYGMLKIVRTF